MAITLRREAGPVAELVLDRPERLNAFEAADIEDACDAVRSAGGDTGLGALLLRGEGRAFCAGADRSFLTEIERLEVAQRVDKIRPGLELTLALLRFPRPTVAAVRGACYGGGAGLALACDVVVAATDLRLGLVFTDLGLPGGDYVAPFLLSRRVGTRRAWQLLAEGAVLDASTALALGLVDEVVDPAELDARARQRATGLAARPRDALAATKRQILELEGAGAELDAQVERQAHALALAFGSAEYAAAKARRS